MNIDHIKTFLEIAASGNFNQAAKRLNITQSTASARIKTLEDQLALALFARRRDGVRLTAAGQRFHRHALNVVRAWERGRSEIALPAGFHSSFGLGSQVSLWERLVLKWIPWMRAQAPQVALHLEADYSSSLMRQIADGLLDVGVMYNPAAREGLIVETLLVERLVLVSDRDPEKNHKPGPGHLPPDYVHVDWGAQVTASQAQAFSGQQAAAVKVGLGELGLRYILENGGSGYFPLRVLQPLLDEKRLYRIPEAPQFERPAYLVYPENPTEPAVLELALAGLREIAAQDQKV
jgi:DNA-binding transcriptional LysR family regulator